MWYKILFNKGSGAVRITHRPIMRPPAARKDREDAIFPEHYLTK